ncbi:MAG: nucleotidyltransferase domain-containing protein [Ruminiclostridium sp.]|nr:nucleotidyltransferase domain-containing protein [Ruminiclostridium sp.]
MPVKNNQITELEITFRRNNLFEKYNLNRVGIFGSAARGEPSKDIDILIEDKVDYRLLSALRVELEKLLNKRVDIVIERYANPIVLHRVKREIVYIARH